jgi:glycosyltransferase involved in cell wall biosynthesis
MEKPIVSICCITYNHVNFISECIEGFLIQKTTFPIEILIFDDASTDGTQEIVRKYASKDIRIKTFLQSENQWSQQKYGLIDWLFPAAQGKYIAICEGDDYWTDPFKLQKQVDFLEKNNDFSICFTDYIVYNESNKEYSYPGLIQRFKNKTVFTSRNIILNNILPTATAMFRVRKEVFSKLDLNLYPGDWFLHILNSEYGKIKFLPFESAVYRKHDGGVCSAISPIINNQKYIKSIKIFRKVYSKNYKFQFLFNIVVIKIRLQNIKFKLLGK